MKLTSIALLLAILPVPGAQADGLGRLFFTPEQRAQLEREHARLASETGNPPALTLNGIVQKSDGTRTIWVNGVAQNADNSGKWTPDVHAIAVPGKSQPVEIKVGQSLLPEPSAEK